MVATDKFKVLYLAHDLTDAAVKKRMLMLLAGGAHVTVAGFRRSAEPAGSVAGCTVVDLGQTYNAGFLQRIVSVLRVVLTLRWRRDLFEDADLIIARNLEMLAIAVRGRSLCRHNPAIVYESLDIHRLLLKGGLAGGLLRRLEGWCAKRASLLITSSPAFVSSYFNTLSRVRLPVKLVENKVLMTDETARSPLTPRAPGPVWRIGWFGVIRCKKSLTILSELARKSEGSVEVIIRGKPAEDLFADFAGEVAQMPGVKFLGAYKAPDDLAMMYAQVHFTWAIDMFEEGLNSSWLLPNRLYEGGLYGAVPIAISSVETGRFLQKLGIGVTLKEPLQDSLAGFFKHLDAGQYSVLEQAAARVPSAAWLSGKEDCIGLVESLRSLSGGAHG